jgi:hypothetical protein
LYRGRARLGEFIRSELRLPAKILLFGDIALTLRVSINDLIWRRRLCRRDRAEIVRCPTQLLTNFTRSAPTL